MVDVVDAVRVDSWPCAADCAGVGRRHPYYRWFSVRSTEESAEQILKRRYARGEIDREDYERRLNDIRR
jgi:hypothetical protein